MNMSFKMNVFFNGRFTTKWKIMEQGEDLLSSESYRHKWLDQVMDLWAQQAVHVIWDRFQGEN